MDRYALRIGIAFLLYLGTCWGGPLPSIAVGTGKPNLQSYSTIQDAVGNVAAGGTILVCAGAYPEQVLITKPLTMKGVLSGKAAASLAVSGCGGSFPPPTGYTLSGNTMTDGNNGLRMTNSNTTAPNTYSSVTTPVSSCT